ncbi:AAA family ATPase [Hathewaya histolytica]|uniref:AAA family ATPase n=1 Tax=Hathewaya histolytica TaxID=1498 RepID=UPI003B679FD5
MIKLLSHKDIFFDFDIEGIEISDIESKEIMDYKNIYEKLKKVINIKEPCFNIFLVDEVSEEKIEDLMDVISKNSTKPKASDLAYINYGDGDKIRLKSFKSGNIRTVERYLEYIKEFYSELIVKFYNSPDMNEKNAMLENSFKKRNEILKLLTIKGEEKGFKIVHNQEGFSFIPIGGEESLTEEEFDALDMDEKNKILNSLKEMKAYTKTVMKELKDIEDGYLEGMKHLLSEYLTNKTEGLKKEFGIKFRKDNSAIQFLLEISRCIERELIENMSKDFTDNAEKFISTICKYSMRIITENNNSTPVIYEKFPNYKNIFGYVQYKNKNDEYMSEVNHISVGSLLKANGGYLILDAKSILEEQGVYLELKKILKGKKFKFEENKGLLSLFSSEKFNLEEIPVDIKVILVGSYKYFNLFYNYDEDFKKLFKIHLESDPLIKIDSYCKEAMLKNMLQICKDYRCKPLTNKAIKEVARLFSKEAEKRDALYFNHEKLKDIMILSSTYVKEEGKRGVSYEDIINLYNRESLIEKEIKEQYKSGKIILKISGNSIGEANGLSVIQGSGLKFGRPMRITCTCSKGKGEIIDIQKENDLSGKVHNKSVSILKGLLSNLIGGYNKIPVDFNVSFEQIYGMVEGDSASVAEALVIISSFLKIPIKQNIAVTGSINQFGDVQPVGGINHKIEGFFDTCKSLETIQNKGVLIPLRNTNNIVLKEEIEEEVRKGNFHIYAMENLLDAIEVMFYKEDFRNINIIEEMERELRKYTGKRDKK